MGIKTFRGSLVSEFRKRQRHMETILRVIYQFSVTMLNSKHEFYQLSIIFSLQFQYFVRQTSDENKENHQLTKKYFNK